MAYIEVPAGTDVFQMGYQVGFQDGLSERPEDTQNLALEAHRDWFMWNGGYTVGYKCGREYRLAYGASRLLLEQETAKYARAQQRQLKKSSSVFWLIWGWFSKAGGRFLGRGKAL